MSHSSVCLLLSLLEGTLKPGFSRQVGKHLALAMRFVEVPFPLIFYAPVGKKGTATPLLHPFRQASLILLLLVQVDQHALFVFLLAISPVPVVVDLILLTRIE